MTIGSENIRHLPVITRLHKSVNRFSFSLLTLALFAGISGCGRTPNETWHCYDTQGHPAEGVLIVSSYGMPSCDEVAVNHRFSDAKGRVKLDLDKDNPYPWLNRGHACIYSFKLKSGDAGLGESWHEGQPIPDEAVYYDEWNNNIYLKSGFDDPVIWHAALETLIATYSTLRNFPNGGAKLDSQISAMISQERALFLGKYGEQVVSIDYLKKGAFRNYHDDLPREKNVILKFKDITLPLPKP